MIAYLLSIPGMIISLFLISKSAIIPRIYERVYIKNKITNDTKVVRAGIHFARPFVTEVERIQTKPYMTTISVSANSSDSKFVDIEVYFSYEITDIQYSCESIPNVESFVEEKMRKQVVEQIEDTESTIINRPAIFEQKLLYNCSLSDWDMCIQKIAVTSVEIENE